MAVVGAGFSPAIQGNIGRSLNLNGMGSIGGRMEEADTLNLPPLCILKQKTTRAILRLLMYRQEWLCTAAMVN
jgi:hypothetical protein